MMNAQQEAPVPTELLEAISEKRVVELHYEREGSAEGKRVVEPHALYRRRDGVVMLFGFQTSGASKRSELPDWRRLVVESVARVRPLSDSFAVREGYDPSAKDYAAGLIASVY